VFDCSFETSNHLGVLLVVLSPCMNESNMLSIGHIIFVFMNICVCPLALYFNLVSYPTKFQRMKQTT